jgi:hypothetical protein
MGNNKECYVIIGDWYYIHKKTHKIKDYDTWVSCVYTDKDKAYNRLGLLNELANIKDADTLMDKDKYLPSIEYLREGILEYDIESSVLYE